MIHYLENKVGPWALKFYQSLSLLQNLLLQLYFQGNNTPEKNSKSLLNFVKFWYVVFQKYTFVL